MTKPQKSEQEIFDIVARHLLTQNKKAVNDKGECVYRGKNGCKCAAGCLIPDDKYDPSFEGFGWSLGLQTKNAALQDLVEAIGHYALIRKLQLVHDQDAVDSWPDKLRGVATDYKLSYAVVDELDPAVIGVHLV